MQIFFGVNCEVARKAVPLDMVAREGLLRGKQLLCEDALNYLKRRRSNPCVFAKIGVTMTDITPGEGWNFVYGLASRFDGVAIFSFARKNPNFFRRQCKVFLYL